MAQESPVVRGERAGNPDAVGIVVIGRNEGPRLIACLESLPRKIPCVYVDSGSTDGSVAAASRYGTQIFELDGAASFTAARARNTGFRNLIDRSPNLEFVQMIDGDCVMAASWLAEACQVLKDNPEACAVFGRRRERYPDRSIYNEQCDREWDVPVGLADACGGDVMIRVEGFRSAGGYDGDLIAGEEPDLCLRLRQKGWQILRIDAEMTLHDANITSFSAWWRRATRSGHAYAQHVWKHGRRALPAWRRELASIVFWAGLLPAVICFLWAKALGENRLWTVLAVLSICTYPAQYARMTVRNLALGYRTGYAVKEPLLLLIGKFAQLAGAARFLATHLRGAQLQIIEYKG